MAVGSHQGGALPKEQLHATEAASVVGTAPNEWLIELEPGSCSFHHGHLAHSSQPNISRDRRRGLATHYVSARCRYKGEDSGLNDAMSVRGSSLQLPGCI